MKIAEFLKTHRESIATEWMSVADDLTPHDLSEEERRDSVHSILDTIVQALESAGEQSARARDPAGKPVTTPELAAVARHHAADRLAQRFSLNQLAAEYRVFRANVTRGWLEVQDGAEAGFLEELIRFNAAVDWSLASAVAWYDERLRQQRDELRKANQTKNEFLAVLGHELRNPLAPLNSGLQLLRRARKKPELLDSLLPMMDRQFSHLTRLVDDLLDFARVSRGQISLQLTPLDLNAPIESALEQLGPSIAERRHHLRADLSESPLPTVGDFERLTQVVANLLSNANRYTEPGGTIAVTSTVEGGEATVRVSDTGYGIPGDKLSTIFELFTQIPEHRKLTGGGGLGIGLALSRQLLEMHEGSLEARSRGLGHGSEFIARLPLNTAATVPASIDAPGADTGPSRRVLVVDDNVDAAYALGKTIELMGHSVRRAHDGKDALAQTRLFRPELVFLDIGLPGMDGLEVARQMRAMPGGDEVVLVAVTGWGQDTDRRKTEEAKFDRHLIKPVAEAQIRQVFVDAAERR